MSRANVDHRTSPHHAAIFRRELPGIAITLLPTLSYEVTYAPEDHVIGFTFDRQDGMHAFASDRRRPFLADPWRVAFTPAGCEIFSTSKKGGEYLVVTVASDVLARLAPGIDQGKLPQFTNLADPSFTPAAMALRRAACSGGAVDDLALDSLVAHAVAHLATQLGNRTPEAGLRAMTAWRLKRILDYLDAHCDGPVRLADLARQVGLSEAYLARAFRAATGTTLHAALVERRIARAQRLMRIAGHDAADTSLAAIAAESGFSSHAHMTIAFRRVLGTTASRWADAAVRSTGP